LPVTILDQESLTSTQHETQRKVFRLSNGFYIVLLYNKTGTTYRLELWTSLDGISWNYDQTVKDWGSDIHQSADMVITDDEAVLFIVYCDTSGNMFLRRGTISGTTITLNTEQQIKTTDGMNKWFRPCITIDRLGYLWIGFQRRLYRTEEKPGLTYLDVSSWNGRIMEWSTYGTEPWLDAYADGNYIATDVKGAEAGDFLLETIDPTNKTLSSVKFQRASRQPSDGNDQIEYHLQDGLGNELIITETPNPDGYAYQETDVSTFLDTWDKINNAFIHMFKITVGKAQAVFCDHVRLKVAYTETVYAYYMDANCIASLLPIDNYSDTPTSADFSDEYTIKSNYEAETGVNMDIVYVAVDKYGAGVSPTVLFAFRGTRSKGDVSPYVRRGWRELSWDGTSFTSYTYGDALAELLDPISIVIASNNNGYKIFRETDEGAAIPPRYRVWITGTGEQYMGGIGTLTQNYAGVISYDSTNNELYVFYTYLTYPNRIVWSKATAIAGYLTWSTPQEIPDNTENIRYFSSAIKRVGNYIPLIYVTQTTAKVRFFEFPIVIPRVQYLDGLIVVST